MGKRGLEKDMKSPDHKKPREQTEKHLLHTKYLS